MRPVDTEPLPAASPTAVGSVDTPRPDDRSPAAEAAEARWHWWRAVAALIACVLCWGAVPVVLRYLTTSIDAWTANGIRYPLSAALYWPLLIAAARRGELPARWWLLCTVPALLTFAGQIFWALSPYYLPASSIGFYVRLSLAWSLMAAMLLIPEERLLLRSWRFLAGLAVSVAGFLVLASSQGAFQVSVSTWGVLIILTCSMFFGFYGVSVKIFLPRIPTLLAFGMVAQMVSLGTITGMFLLGEPAAISGLNRFEWLLIVVSSVLGVGLGHVFMYTAIKGLGPTISSGFQTLAPLVTFALAAVFLGERMGPLEIAAGLVLLLGAALLVASQTRPLPHPREHSSGVDAS